MPPAGLQISHGMPAPQSHASARLLPPFHEADATAFKRQFVRRKGELSSAAIDRGWPHRVVLPARLCERDGYNEIHEFCRDLTLCSRGHALFHDGGTSRCRSAYFRSVLRHPFGPPRLT
jgi:hypothetical protein